MSSFYNPFVIHMDDLAWRNFSEINAQLSKGELLNSQKPMGWAHEPIVHANSQAVDT
jgi:hypothetical protein